MLQAWRGAGGQRPPTMQAEIAGMEIYAEVGIAIAVASSRPGNAERQMQTGPLPVLRISLRIELPNLSLRNPIRTLFLL